MKSLHITIIALLTLLFAACESDLLKTTIGDGTAPELNASESNLVLIRTDSSNLAIKFNWTSPNYLDDTANGNVIGAYVVEIDKTASFASPKSVATGNNLERSFTVYALNKILLDLACETEVENDIYVRVKSIFFNSDTLFSNVLNLKITPYATVIPPAISVPEEVWIWGDALGIPWATPFPQQLQFTKETATSFSITIDLIGGLDYEMITDGTGSNWTPCYRIDPALDPATMVWDGTFVRDGEGSEYGWGSKKFLSPPNDGSYKITLNFQDATFTVVDVSGPPAIEVPEEVWIWGDALGIPWGTPFPAELQFEKIGSTKFSITIFMLADSDYEMITDGTGANWTPCYRIDPALNPSEMTWGGSFVWDGEGSAYSWGSKKFRSPNEEGTYKITIDFQTATYVLAAQ